MLVDIPESIEEFGHSAFEGCESLSTIKFPSKLNAIGRSAFSGCLSLRGKIILPSTLERWDAQAFAGCLFLQEIEFLGAPPSGSGLPTMNPKNLQIMNTLSGVYSLKYARAWREQMVSGQWKGIQMSMKEAWMIYTAIGGILLVVLGSVVIVLLKKRKPKNAA